MTTVPGLELNGAATCHNTILGFKWALKSQNPPDLIVQVFLPHGLDQVTFNDAWDTFFKIVADSSDGEIALIQVNAKCTLRGRTSDWGAAKVGTAPQSVAYKDRSAVT